MIGRRSFCVERMRVGEGWGKGKACTARCTPVSRLRTDFFYNMLWPVGAGDFNRAAGDAGGPSRVLGQSQDRDEDSTDEHVPGRRSRFAGLHVLVGCTCDPVMHLSIVVEVVELKTGRGSHRRTGGVKSSGCPFVSCPVVQIAPCVDLSPSCATATRFESRFPEYSYCKVCRTERSEEGEGGRKVAEWAGAPLVIAGHPIVWHCRRYVPNVFVLARVADAHTTVVRGPDWEVV